jgi:hypothetical protein
VKKSFSALHFGLAIILGMAILRIMQPTEQDFIIELKRIAGALEGVEAQLECVCNHFGVTRPTSKPRSRRGRGEQR